MGYKTYILEFIYSKTIQNMNEDKFIFISKSYL